MQAVLARKDLMKTAQSETGTPLHILSHAMLLSLLLPEKVRHRTCR